jgi:hypothetical protein
MRVHVNDQDRLYQAYWLPIQQALGSELTEFVRHYLMKEGKILKEADVYFELKDRLANSTPAQAQEFLKDLHTHGEMYARFIAPSREPDPGIAKRLDRIRRLKVTVAYPFLLRVFHSFQLRTLSSEQVVETLDTLESFVIRRSVCGMPTNQLRRMLPPVFDAAGGAGPRFVELFREQIGGRRCPDDNSFRSALSKAQLYATAEKNARLRLILEGIELSFNHKELADLKSATIEHVLPQTLTEQWQDELGPGPVETWGTLVHTLGNLTLSAYNAELSNQPFAAKRKAFAESHFQLNRYFADVTRWTPEAIAERGEKLSALAVEIWPDVGRGSSALDTERRPSVSPKAVRFRDIREPAANWKDAYIKLLQLFESESPGLLTRIALVESNYGFVSLQGNRFQRSVIRLGDVYVNTHASATQLQNWCRRVAEIGGLAASDYEFIVSDQA